MLYNFDEFKNKLEEIKEWFSKELKSVRTGRANPAVLDGVRADNYGTPTPLNQMANIGVEDARTLRITPFDPSATKEIEKAITEANLGLGISADEKGVRVIFPELTGERREELIKMVKTKLEEARVSLRQARDEVWSDIQEKERSGEMTEDEKYASKEEMERIVKEYSDKFESMLSEKENEIRND